MILRLATVCGVSPRMRFDLMVNTMTACAEVQRAVRVMGAGLWRPHIHVRDAAEVKRAVRQPITFCENYVPWTYKLQPLAEVLDFIAVHTYPAWEYQSIHDALEYTKQNYYSVVEHYPGKPVVITEAGWTTAANGRGIEPHNASEELQASYYEQLVEWTSAAAILAFVFEAFDEPWKGSPDPLEPEKHWGLFNVDRTPKLAVRNLYPELVRP